MIAEALRWIEEHSNPRCFYCRARGDCHPACPTRLCPLCGGLGVVIDFTNVVGFDADDGLLYGGKLCPRECATLLH